MESQDYFSHVCKYSRSCEEDRGPKKRLKASCRGQRPPSSPPQELELGVPGNPNNAVNHILKYYNVGIISVKGSKRTNIFGSSLC